MFKCPFCGDHIEVEQTFCAHTEWKHGRKLVGDLSRFEAPTYGLNSNAHIWERAAYEESLNIS
jgi:hypothetical protein